MLEDCCVAITGGNLCPFLDSAPVPLWRRVRLKGQSLIFGRELPAPDPISALTGDSLHPEVLGSRSTDLQSGFGGLDGRRLVKGDLLFRIGGGQPRRSRPRQVCRTSWRNTGTLFFCESCWGLRHAPPAGNHAKVSAIRISSHACVQSYRIPLAGSVDRNDSQRDYLGSRRPRCRSSASGGQLVLLMADHQTVGGYPKIATVISADVPKAAQLSIGDRVRFHQVSLETAHQLLDNRKADRDRE